jgi:peptide-methionine (R)-S-oxide reductase
MITKKPGDSLLSQKTPEPPGPSRRRFLLETSAAAALAGLAFWGYRRSQPAEAEPAPAGAGQPKMVRIVEFSDAGARQDEVSVPKIVKSEDEWRKQLTPEAFEVTRHAGTETAFTGPYWNLHDKGLFRCICCDTALFSSETKFDSGTGWPSFYAPLAKENIHEQTDLSFGEVRTAVSCRRCDAHLGHVFDDGPRPTGLRYCMNSVALRFIAA